MQKISKTLNDTLQRLVIEEGIEWQIQGEDLVILVRMSYANPEAANPGLDREGRRKYRDISLQLGAQWCYERPQEMRVEPDGRERLVYNVLPNPFA